MPVHKSGRGLNMVVINPDRATAGSPYTFDTYAISGKNELVCKPIISKLQIEIYRELITPNLQLLLEMNSILLWIASSIDPNLAGVDMVDVLANLNDNRLVVMVSNDDATTSLGSEGFRAIEKIGSTLIRNIGYRESWYIIEILKKQFLNNFPE